MYWALDVGNRKCFKGVEMGFGFRKSVSICPGVRVNFSKKGVGFSAGVKGARISKGADGKVRTTISAPGTGLYHTSTIGGKSKKNKKTNDEVVLDNSIGYKMLAWVCRIIFIPMIILGLFVACVEPIAGIIAIFIGVLEFVYSHKYFKKQKNV